MNESPNRLPPLKARVSRRDFFGRCSAAAGYAVTGAVAGPMAIASELVGKESANAPIRIGILGMGHRGAALAEMVTKVPGVRLVGWFDPCEKAAMRAAARFADDNSPIKSRVFSSEEDLVRSPHVDAVLVAGPSDTHNRQIVAAVEAGKHVLTEKPAGSGAEEIDTLERRFADALDRVFMAGFQRRYDSRGNMLIKWCGEGHLGPMVDLRVDWTQPLGPPRGRHDWMLDPIRTGDWVAEHGDHIWDMLAQLRPEMPVPRVVHARKLTNPADCSLFWKASLVWPDGVSADVRQSFLPGGNFASPGLNVFVQFENGIVDLMNGRVNCVRSVSPPVLSAKDPHEDMAMIEAFVDRVRESESDPNACRAAVTDEFRRLRYVDRLRASVRESFTV